MNNQCSYWENSVKDKKLLVVLDHPSIEYVTGESRIPVDKEFLFYFRSCINEVGFLFYNSKPDLDDIVNPKKILKPTQSEEVELTEKFIDILEIHRAGLETGEIPLLSTSKLFNNFFVGGNYIPGKLRSLSDFSIFDGLINIKDLSTYNTLNDYKNDPLLLHYFVNKKVNRRESLPSNTVLMDLEESVDFCNKLVDAYNKKEIEYVVYDIETGGFEPHLEPMVMVSFATTLDASTGYVIPLILNNDFHNPYKEKKVPRRANVKKGETQDQFELKVKEIVEYNDNIPKMLEDLKRRFYYHEVSSNNLKFTERNLLRVKDSIKSVLSTVPLVGHNLKFDIKFSCYYNYCDIDKVTVFDDTFTLIYLLRQSSDISLRSKDLKDSVMSAFNVKGDWDSLVTEYLSMFRLKKDKKYSNVPTSTLGKYAGLDTLYNLHLYEYLRPLVPKRLHNLISILNKSTVLFAESEYKGISFNAELHPKISNGYKDITKEYKDKLMAFDEYQELYDIKRKSLSEKIKPNIVIDTGYMNKARERAEKATAAGKIDIAKEEYRKVDNFKKRIQNNELKIKEDALSLTSDDDLRELIFGKKGFCTKPSDRYTTGSGSFSVDKAAREYYKEKYEGKPVSNFLKSLDSYKEIMKLVTTYVDPSELVLDHQTNLYYPSFNISRTASGRISSGFHTVPSKSDIKRLYKSRWDGGFLGAGDFSQLELRVMASLSGEPAWLDAYNKGKDLHTATASLIYNIPLGSVTSHQRKVGKQVNFAIAYQSSAKSIAEGLGISVQEAETILINFYSNAKYLSKWIDNQKSIAEKEGIVTNRYGRLIYLHEKYTWGVINRKDAAIASLQRKGVNYDPQGSGSDMMMDCITNHRENFIKKNKLKSIILGTVHDSVEIDIHPNEVFSIVDSMKYHYEKYPLEKNEWLKCPMVLDFELGTTWGGACEFSILDNSDNKYKVNMHGEKGDVLGLLKNFRKNYYTECKTVNSIELSKDHYRLDNLIRSESALEVEATIWKR